MGQQEKELRLIYIMGDGRSGSTVLSIILGNHPEVASAGELNRWVEFGGYPKSGNQKVEDHRFWEAVRRTYFEQGAASFDLSRLQELQQELEGYSNFLKLVFNQNPPQIRAAYYAHTGRLLRAINAMSGKHIIVDASKRPGRGYVLLRCPGVKVRIIHLVRDPRGVMWSSLKRNIEQKTKSPIQAMLHYSVKNLLSTIVHWLSPRKTVLRVRYEELITEPRRELNRIGDFLGLTMNGVIENIEKDNPLLINYLLDGNRIRTAKAIKLKLDDEWKTKLSRRQKLLATLLTLPFSLAYGYIGDKSYG